MAGSRLGVPYTGVYGVPAHGGYGYGVPGATYYSSGYYGVAPVVPPVAYAGYGYRPYYGVAPIPDSATTASTGRLASAAFGRRGWRLSGDCVLSGAGDRLARFRAV